MSRELAALVADPERAAHLGPEELPRLIGELEGLKAALWARLQSGAPRMPEPNHDAGKGPDELLTAQEAADRLGVSKRWVYRKADTLPFTKRLGGGTLRFSSRGLERWKATR